MAMVVKGFSLIESIVSIAILSLTIALFTTSINTLFITSEKVDKSELCYAALQKLDSITALQQTLEIGETVESNPQLIINTKVEQFESSNNLILITVKAKSVSDSVTFSKIITTIHEK